MRLGAIFTLLALVAVAASAEVHTARAANDCEGIGQAQFVCLSEGAEDIAAVPNSDWVVISGTLRAVNTKDHSEVVLFSTDAKFDKAVYAACPGPITGKEIEEKKFRAGGLNVRPGANGVHTLYFLHRAENRAALEVFEINVRGKTPTITWIGCAPYPADAGFNSVAYLPDHGAVATNFLPRHFGGYRGDAGKPSRDKLTAGENVSDLWEWSPAKGWFRIAGSEGSGLNGIEASMDGKWIYADEWAIGKVSRYSRTPGQPAVREVIASVNFHPDNLRWQPDGTLIAAGQTGSVEDVLNTCLTQNDCSKNGSGMVVIDPNTKKMRVIVQNYPANKSFEIATAGMMVGNQVWVAGIGSLTRRLALFPLK